MWQSDQETLGTQVHLNGYAAPEQEQCLSGEGRRGLGLCLLKSMLAQESAFPPVLRI